MNIRDFRILADENLHRKMVAWLREQGFDVRFVREENALIGSKDIDLFPIAYQEERVILTQDNDFGQIVFTQEVDFIGIIYLRPGHFPAEIHIETFQSILNQDLELSHPFILIGEHKHDSVKLRIRGFKK
ncbi:DUF5615 family PIN-like protein [Haliscomenobacter hydrossis]|uniref:DUF5615 domain-containing protein n=1 Tax=Haliscomenobacter hydrossis (strain ATCC 27775 / DSM 1100 / LMG 10767 / O) TaxID=760192 RepID=F4KPJ4_HALH1|nr:DUF5615 family PIN-like protein [Haliscomenobacter hydrossis]AEE50932.1 hypothetical protein Halhy_3069 [Haliscomenobacter hydrossis DSM 1100]